MRQVRTCDFCGDDAAGLYEPYPPSVPDGPRLLLCAGCRDRLSSIVEPLVAALEGGAEPDSGGTTPSEPRDERADTPAADVDENPSDPDQAAAVDSSDSAPAGASPDPDTTEAAEVGESRDAGGRPQSERAGAPPGYRKVMRLLENREFPVDRTEAEQLAAEAYELDEDAVADAIDHAIQYGRLREVRGELTR